MEDMNIDIDTSEAGAEAMSFFKRAKMQSVCCSCLEEKLI